MTTPASGSEDHQIGVGVGVGVGPGQMGLPGNIRIGSSDNPLLKEPTCAEPFKYSALLPWDLVRTEKNSSVRKKPLAFLLRPLEVLKPVAPQVGKLSLAVVTSGSTLKRGLGRMRRIIANSLG